MRNVVLCWRHCIRVISCHYSVNQKLFNIKVSKGCKRYDGCFICILFQISWQLQTQIVKNRILSDSLLGNKLY